VIGDAHLPGQHCSIAHPRRSGDPHLGDQDHVLADVAVVADLDQVVDLGAAPHHRVAEGGAVVTVAADLRDVPAGAATEIALMNELGAGEFDCYEDAAGASLAGAAIGTWDTVDAATASFVSSRRRLAFALAQVPGGRLMRGRESVAGRLAWAGFGYVLRPGRPTLTYDVHISRVEGRRSRP